MNTPRRIGLTSKITAALWLIAALAVTFQAPSNIAAADELELKKVGEARLRVFLWSIYNSRLYTPSGSYREGDRPLRLEIEYLINVRRAALVERTGDEWDAMGRRHPHKEVWLTRLNELWPDIQEKDVLSIELDGENRSTFFYNGERLGRIEDPDFGPQFVDIWLSEDSTRPALREALLGDSEAN
ncbi:MAG: chalcone isomerase family protein [Pseudomonadota bacterium]